jgi:phage terminase large subunit-like protein
LMPWQRHVVDVALEHHDAGRLVYRDVAIGTPRQSGKSVLVLAVVLHRMLSAPAQRVVYGAQTRLAARVRLFDTWWPRIRRSPLRELFSLTRATGAESLRSSNGSVMSLLSTDEAAGHGETLDLGVLDECWSLDASAEQSVRPAMATRANAQLWMLSTAGTERSVFWRSKVDAGRTAAEVGVTDGLAYFEWSAADDVDVTDPATWPEFMPALGHTVEESTIAADLRTMQLAEWRRAYANQWPDEADQGWAVIPRDVWEASKL